MVDEIDTTTTEVETSDSTAEKQDKTKEEKLFHQKDIDMMITARLAKEKQTSKRNIDDLTAEKTNLEDTVKNYELVFQRLVTEAKREFPEMYLPLLDKLSLAEQYAFLVDPKNKLSPKKAIPETKQTDENINDNKAKNQKIRKFL